MKAQIDGGEDSTGNWEQMWRESDLVGREADLLEKFSGVSVVKRP